MYNVYVKLTKLDVPRMLYGGIMTEQRAYKVVRELQGTGQYYLVYWDTK